MPSLPDRRFRSEFVHNDDGSLREYSATRCGHCPAIIVMGASKEHARGCETNHVEWDFCMKCMKTICQQCAAKAHALGGECIEYERLLLLQEGRVPDAFPPGSKHIQRDIAILLNIGR